jgi:alpha/beta superfamily hydrolase
MSRRTVPIPGARRVEATLSQPGTGSPDALEACVVMCPPHPEFGGHRGDPRLEAVAQGLLERDIATLRFDYGPWDEGYGEREDARNALRWAADRADRIGAFGYSFGGAIATLAVATVEVSVDALSLLSPASRLSTDLDAAAALESVTCPVQITYGERDETADWGPLVEAASSQGHAVVTLAADHHFVGQHDRIREAVVPFLSDALR